MPLVLLDGTLTADIVPSAGATLPYTAYAAWATELGVSSTVSLQALDADDNAWPITLGSAPISGGTTATAGFSSEGAIGLYAATPGNTSAGTLTLTGVSRMYMTATRPDAFFTFHPQADLRTEAVLLQRSGSTTIIRGLIRQYSSSTYTVRFAIRLNGGTGRFIFETIDQPFNFMLFKASSNTNIYTSTCSAGSLREFATTVSLANIANGFTETQFGVAELLSRFAYGFTGTMVGVPGPPMQALGTTPTTVFGTPELMIASTGSTTTVFGAPQIAPSPLGFKPIAFGIGSIPLVTSSDAPGTAFGLAEQAFPAEGFSDTSFGSPVIVPSPPGFSGTTFGAVASRVFFRIPTFGRVTRFGTANSPYNQTMVASSLSPATGWGRPFGFRWIGPITNLSCAAASIYPGIIGAPAYAGVVAAASTGSAPTTAFGAPTAFMAAAVTASCSGADLSAIVGTPTSSLRYRSTAALPETVFGLAAKAPGNETTGAASTAFGTPTSARSQYATGTLHQTRWGLALATRSTDHPARMLYAGNRFGQSKATLVKGERASGATTTTFGAHISAWRMRGLHIPPGTCLGMPRVTRTPSC
jgi:hypothetical protein